MRALAIALLALSPAQGLLAQQAPKVIFEEPFKGKLKDGWTWVREDAAARKLEDGVLKLRSLPGSFWGKSADAKNVLVRRVPRSGIGLSLGVEVAVAFRPETPSEQAGILLRADDDCYVKLVLQNVDGAIKLTLAVEDGARAEPVAVYDFKGTSVGLRLTWEGRKVVAESRPEGGQWAILSYTDNFFKDEKAEISAGLFVHGAAEGADRWAEFRAFKVTFDE